MATVASKTNASSTEQEFIPPLESGDHLSVREFERRYEAMPPETKAELIEGVVYVASPVSNDHGTAHSDVAVWLGFYRAFTPGLVSSLEGTVRLDARNEPQPDIHMRLLPEYGGRTSVDADGYVAGAPEFIIEVARSSVSYDLHQKLEAYRRNQVREYVVWRVDEGAIDWFMLREGGFVPAQAGPDGLLRSEVFPGLWLDTAALVRGDLAALFRVVQAGVASPEHATFVESLNQHARSKQPAPPRPGGDAP
jgi:Uma2 family endonuclease